MQQNNKKIKIRSSHTILHGSANWYQFGFGLNSFVRLQRWPSIVPCRFTTTKGLFIYYLTHFPHCDPSPSPVTLCHTLSPPSQYFFRTHFFYQFYFRYMKIVLITVLVFVIPKLMNRRFAHTLVKI